MVFPLDFPGLPIEPSFLVFTGVIGIVVGLLLAFLGRKILKALVFIVGGLVGASLGYGFALQYAGQSIAIIAAIAGFLLLGFLSLVLIRFVFALGVGYAGFQIVSPIANSTIIGIIVGVILFIIGWLLFNKFLTGLTALAGGLLIFRGFQAFLPTWSALLIAVVLGLVGLYYQLKH